jgi:PAS domain S-box-containing protein
LSLYLAHSLSADSSATDALGSLAQFGVGILACLFLVLRSQKQEKPAPPVEQPSPAPVIDRTVTPAAIEAGNSLRSLHAMQLEILDLQRKQQLLIERAVDVICVVDTDATIRSINRASEKAWGYMPKDLIGQPLSAVLPEAEVEKMRKTVLGKVRSIDRINVETKIRRADGSDLDVVWTGYWSARESGLFCIVHDVSEQKQLARMKDEFFAMVSHDLKNPLTSIMGLLTLLEQGVLGNMTDHGKKVAAGAQAECNSMLRLLDDYLQIERVEAGVFKLEPSEFDLQNTIENTIHGLDTAAQERKVTIQSQCEELPCFADEQRIMQVLNNLIGNAIKFSSPGTTVRVSAQEREEDLIVWVEDQGRGIPPEKLNAIFEKFKQIESGDARELGGTGLGLAICKSIVAQHGGEIGVESEPGKGSRFWFTIPKRSVAVQQS